MADIDTNNGIMEVTSHEDGLERSDESVNVMDGSIGGQGDEDACEDDILQQALVEASSFPDGVEIQYSAESVGLQEGSIIHPGEEGTTFITADTNGQISAAQLAEHFENGSYQVLAVTDGANIDNFVNDSVAEQNGTIIELQKENSMDTEYIKIDPDTGINGIEIKPELQVIEQNQLTEVVASTSMTNEPETKQIQLTAVSDAAPLGSSLNPIRIIQQGNQYTPVQQLSTEQLQQIMQVVQQQQIAKSLDTGSSVLYNQQTNTRIVYRVIYPSDLHKDGSNDGMRAKDQQTLTQTIPKRVYKKRIKEDEQDRIEGPELSKEEKDARKKLRAKTRSGRVSKPPKHMVKDYKHIHVLDYDEDYDDSDGGYSDYKVNEEQAMEDESGKGDDNLYIAPGLNSSKPKNWKCISCDKAYIGRAGLARHLKLYPSHGSMDPEGDAEMEPPPPGTVIVPTSADDNGSPGVPVTSNGLNSTANSTASLSEDSRDSTYSLPYVPTPRPRGQRGRPRGSRSSWRGRGAYNKIDMDTKRRNKLKEITRECSDEELMEIVLPRLAKVITLWEFLLMKVEIGDPATPHADDIFKEYEKLHHHVKKLCQEYLQFVPESEVKKDTAAFLQIDNGILAQALGLQVGCHKVKDIPASETEVTYKYKFQTTNHNADTEFTNRSFLKRTVEVVSPEDLVQPKRTKLTPVKSNTAVLPVQNVQSNNTGFKPEALFTNALAQTAENSSATPEPRIMKLIPSVNPVISSVSASLNSVPTVSNTAVILTNSLPQTPIIIQTPTAGVSGINSGQSPGLISGRPASSRAAVSLLNNSKQIPVKPESQKFLILSGTNTNPHINVPISRAEPVARSKTNNGFQQIVQQSSSSPAQINTNNLLSGPVSQNVLSSSAIILPASVSSSTPVKSDPPQQPVTLLPINSASPHPLLISIPQSTQSQMLQTKLIVTDPGGTTQADSVESMISVVESPLKLQNNSVEIVDADQVLNPVENNANFISDGTTYSLNGDVKVENGALESDNVVYALADGDADDFSVSGEDSSQTNIVYAVDPEMVLLNKSDSSNVSTTATELINSTDHRSKVLTSSTEEAVGVLNSIDNTDTSSIIKISTYDAHSSTDTAQLAEQPQMAANELNNSQDESLKQFVENQLEPEQTESVQMTATIFQTEDGSFLIQNSDGTTLQLQGTDGQSLTVETVQALLAMDGGTEFITDQGDVT